jgi:hypothetical protein
MRHWISERVGFVTEPIGQQSSCTLHGSRFFPVATTFGVVAIATSLLLAAVPMRAWADPCPPPKDKLAGIQMNTCPQALLNALNPPAPARRASIKHEHAGESAAEGIGNSTCAEFNEKSGEDSTTEDTYFDWSQGYMTGLDSMQLNDSGQSRNLYSEPASEQEHRIHLLCAEHPEEPYIAAVLVLFHSLPKNAPIKALHSRVLQ